MICTNNNYCVRLEKLQAKSNMNKKKKYRKLQNSGNKCSLPTLTEETIFFYFNTFHNNFVYSTSVTPQNNK